MARLMYIAASAVLVAVSLASDIGIIPDSPLEAAASRLIAFLERLLIRERSGSDFSVLETLRSSLRAVFSSNRRHNPHA